MKKIIATITLFALLALPAQAAEATRESLTNDEIKETILDAVNWMQTQQEANGHMRYEYIPFLNRYVDDDNMVRQAGSLYELGEVLIRMQQDDIGLTETIENSIKYFEENTYDGDYITKEKTIEIKCLLKTEEKCSLGGTSLALIGILDIMQSSSKYENRYSKLAEGYKDFIVAMSLPEGGYQSSYYLNKSQNKSESPFANGEAFLALVRYYKYNPTDEIKEIIDNSFDYFTQEYSEGQWDNNFYLWGMAALKDLHAMDPKEEYYEYVKQYTDWRISTKGNSRFTSHNYCAYIEGVVSAYSIIEPNVSSKELVFYDEEIDFWLAKSDELQVEADDIFKISFSNGPMFWLRLKNANRSIGGFLTDLKEPVQRIDFTQHCLSSYLQKHVDIDGNQL